MEEETTDVKRKTTPSIPANYVSILQLRERWIEDKERKQRKEQEEKDEERRRNQHAEEQQKIEDDPKKPREDLGETRLNESDLKLDGSTDGGEARRGEEEEEETAAIGSERGEDEGLTEKKRRGRRKRYDSKKKKKKRTNQEVVEECGSIKPTECTVKEIINTTVKDQIRVYKKKEENTVTAIETQFKDLSIKRVQETKKLKAQTRSLAMVWVKKG